MGAIRMPVDRAALRQAEIIDLFGTNQDEVAIRATARSLASSSGAHARSRWTMRKRAPRATAVADAAATGRTPIA
jgi:hypothetical protein